MAEYTEVFSKKLDWQMPFQRTGKFPLDRTDLFSSYDDAVKYAAGNTEDPDSRELCGSSYVGQIITVFENDKVTVYKIDADRKLSEVGSATLGDGKSIDLGDGNILTLKNFGKSYYKYNSVADENGNHYTLVNDGTFPAGLQPKTRLAEDGSIELAWYEPSSTTVEGLSEQMASLTETVNTMQQTVSDNTKSLSDKVDKVEGKQLSTEDYTSEEKSKLDGISEGAQVNVIESILINGEKKTPVDKAVDITIPTKVSDITNDKNFIDSTVDNLVNYYKKSETYNKEEISELLAGVSTLDILVVGELPTENISFTTIYLVPKSDSETQDTYDEYIYVKSTSSWEMIGNTVIDLTNYLQKNGDSGNTTVNFTVSEVRELPISDETVALIIGKVVKYLTDLKSVAFTGSYNDLVDKPAQVTCFLADVLVAGSIEVAINIPDEGHFVDAVVRDATGVQVLTDVECSNNVVTVSVSEALDFDLSILVTYYR